MSRGLSPHWTGIFPTSPVSTGESCPAERKLSLCDGVNGGRFDVDGPSSIPAANQPPPLRAQSLFLSITAKKDRYTYLFTFASAHKLGIT